jgi:hypothetical protein
MSESKTPVRKDKHALTISLRTPQTSVDLDESSEATPNSTNPFKERPTYVIPGFAYSIVDSFENENFNMVYVHKRTEHDIKVNSLKPMLNRIAQTRLP